MADSAPAPSCVGPVLHELEVVVAERPEVRLGALEGPGVVVALERGGGFVDQVGQPHEHRAVERLAHRAGIGGRRAEAEGELRRVEQLDGEPAADLHLALVELHVHAGPAVGRPVAHGVGPMAFEQGGRIVGHVAGRLRQLLAVGIDDEAGDRRVLPRKLAVEVVRAHHGGEQPGADDLVGLGAQVHREGALEQVLVVSPAAHDLRGERRRRPGVHHVGIGREAAGLVALGLLVAGCGDGGGVDGQRRLIGHDRRQEVGDPVGIDGVPDREGHAEEPLAGDVPVAHQPVDPVLVAHPHEVGPPGQLLAIGEQGVLRRGSG